MRRNNYQYKVGDKILVKRRKNSKPELEFMGPFPIAQINDNGAVHFQKGIINDDTNIRRIKPFFECTKRFFTTQFFSLYQHDNGTVHFQQGIINDAADNISTSHISLL